MFLLEKNFAKMFVPAYCKGDKNYLAALPEIEIFDHLDPDERDEKRNVRISNGVATINILGVLGDGIPRWMSHTSYVSIVEGIRIAEADESVEQIILNADGPGGFVSGWMPAALAIMNTAKPTTAIVGNMAASATWMLIAMADKIIARDNLTSIGSIGVAAEYMDLTRMFQEMGIDIHTFTNDESKDKRPDLATVSGRQVIQDGINDVYHEIEALIAVGRNVSIEFLRENFGAGRVMLAKDALSAKMVDEIKQKSMLSDGDTLDTEDITQENEEMEIKTIQELKTAYPSFCEEISKASASEAHAKGREEGTKAEKKRVNDWAIFAEVETEAVIAGISGDEEISSSTIGLFSAKKVQQDTLKDMSDENGDDVNTGAVKDDEIQTAKDAEFESALDAELAKK